MTIDDQRRIIEAYKPLAQMGVGEEILTNKVQLAGKLRTMKRDLSPEDAANLSEQLYGMMGESAQKMESIRAITPVKKLIDAGRMSETRALGLSVAAHRDAMDPTALREYATSLDKEYDRPTGQPKTLMAQKAYSGQLALSNAKTVEERESLLANNEDAQLAAWGDQRDAVLRMLAAGPLREKQLLQYNDKVGGLKGAIARTAHSLGVPEAGREAEVNYKLAAQRELNQEQLGETVGANQRALQHWNAAHDKDQDPLQYFVDEPIFAARRFAAWMGGDAAPAATALRFFGGDAARSFESGESRIHDHQPTVEAIKALHEEVKKGNEERRSGRHAAAHVGDTNEP